ncbi:hypothetical protein SteCoe_19789 [Stentor coeruleus]|uniref:FHA domain-containing protein n=1 Tax=Stentor coeruleus TaxID=5963 RepID=A0A1R2BTB5_9CILI|nr:hypothetical protein SteCoe_19789 [Stentor coeruleus]
MENFRKAFSSLTRRCCFSSDYTHSEPVELEGKSSLDITSSQIPPQPIQVPLVYLHLKIIVIESEKLPLGKTYNISPIGLNNSERTSYGDGCVYAGSLYQENNRIVNDMILPQNEKGVGKRHFMIQYKAEPKSMYLIKDLGDGMGTFVRISKPLPLQTNFIISFGDSHMIVVIDNSYPPKLTLRFIDGPKLDEKFKFSQNDSPIVIGRMNDCAIRFDDNSLSRYHCIITYKDRWIIQDGDGNKISTNGTWLFVEEFFEIHNEMIFKVGETTFRTETFTAKC